MRVVIYIMAAWLGCCAAFAQTKNVRSGELWAVWEEAERKLEAGKFDDAIILYRAYGNNFSSRLKQVQALKTLYNQGQALQKAGKYYEAVNTYKKHRTYEGIGSLAAFENRIEECLSRMENTNPARVKTPDRRILAAEFSYKGLKKLRELDTLGASNDYNQAKKYGGDFSATLKEQYEEGLQITRALGDWGWRYRKLKSATATAEAEKEALESYRNIKGVPVLTSVETRVREITAQIEGKNSMLSYARYCDTDLLLNYVNQNQARLNYSESLISTLNQYKSIQNKVATLRGNIDNSGTVGSAYFSLDSMVRSVRELPVDVKAGLLNCIKAEKTQTFTDYAGQARRAGNLTSARKFEDIANDRENSRNAVYTRDTAPGTAASQQKKPASEAPRTASAEPSPKPLRMFKAALTAGIGSNRPIYRLNNQRQKMSYGLVAQAGGEFAFIDHKNPIDLILSAEYLNTYYYTLNESGRATESFKFGGAGIALTIKIHPTNTNPNKLRPYFKVGREAIIPLTYQYENFSLPFQVNSRNQIRNVVSSIHGGPGVEIQKPHFGFFAELIFNYGIGGMYDNGSTTLGGVNRKVDANFMRGGLKVGVRFW
ncbi:hypothetical protein [Dyadobacter sandarakinus]|uniref:Outer membrane protein beta-barrel domain-containing protein n=1 Tax=Dyadobacter sandarakinus TaxID=2747268 RepID=A0ABX7I438_9BACT|nr:hypothetical protein [Dyadobacter sandarakinus]QRR00599.1 hypothetical protein HWI92_06605 [Dyadobacter sandarakinus]